jgi:hypothetical protein
MAMSDAKTPDREATGVAPDPKKRADELRGLSPDVRAQAREAGAVVRSHQAEKATGSVTQEKKNWDSASRDRHMALAEIGQPSAGRSALGNGPEQTRAPEQRAEGTAKNVEQSASLPEPAATAAKYRGAAEPAKAVAPPTKAMSPQLAAMDQAAQKRLKEAEGGLKGVSKAQNVEGTGAPAKPSPTSKARGNEQTR